MCFKDFAIIFIDLAQFLAAFLITFHFRCATLQHELNTSETVQKDFVKLSQNLQIELEKIRQAEQVFIH